MAEGWFPGSLVKHHVAMILRIWICYMFQKSRCRRKFCKRGEHARVSVVFSPEKDQIGRLFLIIFFTIQTTVPAGLVWWDDMTKSWDFYGYSKYKTNLQPPPSSSSSSSSYPSSIIHYQVHFCSWKCTWPLFCAGICTASLSQVLSEGRPFWVAPWVSMSCLNRHGFTLPKATKCQFVDRLWNDMTIVSCPLPLGHPYHIFWYFISVAIFCHG